MKPGYKSTEFWGKSAVQLISMAAVGGFISPEQAQVVGDVLPEAVQMVQALFGGAVQLVGMIGVVVSELWYGKGRAQEKRTEAYVKK